MAQFQIPRTVTFAVEAETEEEAQSQVTQWHGLAAGGQYDKIAGMTAVQVTLPEQGPERMSMATGA